MRNHILTVLMLLVFAALVCDITIRSQSVHAQNPTKVYIDGVGVLDPKQQLTVQGKEIVGFACANQTSCFVLSK
jgi:hypothetical protein